LRRDLVPLVVFGVVAAAAIIALGLAIDWFPEAASTQATQIDDLYDVVLIASVPFFVLVEVVVLYCVWRFRMRPGQEDQDGPPIHGSTSLEVFWTAVPALLLVALCTYTYFVLEDMEEKKPNELVVVATGQQFTWTFQYPGPGQRGRPIGSNQLYLPKDRPILFRVRSKDVIHDFWVPQLRMKVDAVPGITTEYRVTPNKIGNYPVVCAELCGLGHSTMRQTAHVMAPAQFASWMRRQRGEMRPQGGAGGADGAGRATGGTPAPAGGAGAGDAAAGKQVFTGGAGCGGCHKLADAGTTGATGPDLAILKGKSAEEIRTSIVDPGAAVAQGYADGIMPANFGQTLSDKELNDLVAYLQEATK
jgi:cytochrome c oxidase subunit II